MFRREDELEAAVQPFLGKHFCRYSFQVPIHNRVVDLAAIDHKGSLVGIEFKLKNWKRALEQIQSHRSSFDYLYVCVPHRTFLNSLQEAALKRGVGVMVFDTEEESFRIEVKAERVVQCWKPNQKYIKDFIEKGETA